MNKSIADYSDEKGDIIEEQLKSLLHFLNPNKSDILEYLKSPKHTIMYSSAPIMDVIAKEIIHIPLCTIISGEYAWDTEDIYYFEKYDLKLKDDFIKYALSQINIKNQEKTGATWALRNN